MKQNLVISRDRCCLTNKKKCKIFLMSTEEQLVNYVHHTRGFIQTFFLFNPFFPSAPFLYPLKTSECFEEVEKG